MKTAFVRHLIVCAAALVLADARAETWTDPDTGYTWTYYITKEDSAKIYNNNSCAISPSPIGAITIPSMLAGKPVTRIEDYAFYNCSELAGATFQVDADEFAAVFGQAMLPYLPDGVTVTQKGAKWTLPKAGKVVYKNGEVDESKLGENPCGLKLTYKAKDGTFKGTFKVYAEVKGKPKATTVNVTGFMLNGVGYGTATIKGKGSVAVMSK